MKTTTATKYNLGLAAAAVTAMLLTASILAAPMAYSNMTTGLSNSLPSIFGTAFATSEIATHDIVMSVEKLPNGQLAYKMVEHSVTTSSSTEDITAIYDANAVIPGPTLFVRQGDTVNLELQNNLADKDASFDAPEISGASVTVSPGDSESTSFAVPSAGTYLYHDDDSELIGLFGALVVGRTNGQVEQLVNGDNGLIQDVQESQLDRQYVLFMVGSTFWGTEISDGGNQTPLWTNPTLGATLGEKVRFHVLSIGHGHTFHLHAHRWVDPGTSNIIDTKLMETPSDTHTFTIEAGDQVGAGDWQYHCHVFAHMEAGMHGTFKVVESGSATSMAGASPYGVHPLYLGGESSPSNGLVTFEITDEPGKWFKATNPLSATEQSLVLARPGDSVNFVMSDTNTVHTITSLLWPTGAEHMPMDEVQSYKGGGIVHLSEPGLYVFTCKVHPYMFGGVIADDLDTQIDPTPLGEGVLSLLGSEVSSDGQLLLDLGDTVTLVTGLEIPTGSDLALRLTATFFKATDSANWKDYREDTYNPSYPAVSVRAYNPDVGTLAVINLDQLLDVYFDETAHEDISEQLYNPDVAGVGEVWVNTQFEHTESKSKPGTATAVNATTWKVTKKVALPEVNMNNPHNMWTDKYQSVIYQTEWFDNKLTIFDRETGAFVDQITVGEAPSHVMTRANNDDIHVALNGEEGVAEILAGTNSIERIIAMQGYGEAPTHPHAHWMSSDGQKMVTPNTFTHDSTLYGFDTEQIDARTSTGILPIATGMMPDDSKYYVANLLSSSLDCISMTDTPSCVDDDGTTLVHTKTINLLEDYNPLPLNGITETTIADGAFPLDDVGADGVVAVGALPIQTPVSPDGSYMVTANTLSGTITILDTSTDEVVAMLGCDPGCHGVQFGAKANGGYYAYISSKFSNALIVVDMDTLAEVGRILLVADAGTDSDDAIVNDDYTGMGGQGIMPIPNVYNGWVQQIPQQVLDDNNWALTPEQRNPES